MLPVVPHLVRKAPVSVNFWIRLLPKSATNPFPLPSTATPTGPLNCLSMLPVVPHFVRNAPQVGIGVGVSVAVGVGVSAAVDVADGVAVAVAVGVGVAVTTGGGVVVAVGIGVTKRSAGYAIGSGRDSASRQSTLNSVTQSTHATRSLASVIGPPHAGPPGTVTGGQSLTKPIWFGGKLGARQVTPSDDPAAHALQILLTFFDCALAIAGPALVSPGTGHGSVAVPLSTALRHLPRILSLARRNLEVSLPIVPWHLIRSELPDGLARLR